MRDRGGVSAELGDALLVQAYQMFTWWHRVREGTLQRSTFRAYMTPLRREVERLLDVGSACGVPKTAGTCRDILKRRQALWTSLNLSQFVAHKHWGRRCASPCGFSANLLEIGESQRWLLASMPPNFDLLQTAIN
jgi:transposase